MSSSKAVLAGLALALAAPVAAQARPAFSLHEAVRAPESLALSGTFRVRYETLEGQTRPGIDPHDNLVALRSTLLAEYHKGSVRIGGELWDSRVYDAEPGGGASASDVNAFELVQAYVSADLDIPALGRGGRANLRAGRFIMDVASRRLIAADDYRNTTNGFTGLRFRVQTSGRTALDAFYVLPQARLPESQAALLKNKVRMDTTSFGLKLWGAALSQEGLPHGIALDGSFIGLDERDSSGRATKDRSLRTVTLRVLRAPKPGRLDFEAEGSYQFGTVSGGTRPTDPTLDVSATFTHLEVGYAFEHPWRPRLSLEYERASGDDSKASFGRFDTLYGSRRSDMSPSGIYNVLGRANVDTPAVRIEAAPTRRFDVGLTYRLMWLASRTDSFSTAGVRDASGRSGGFAGRQWDARLRYWLVPENVRLELNGVLLDKSRFLKTAPNAPRTGDARYLSLSVSTVF